MDGGLTLDPGPEGTVACAALHVYRGSPEGYLAFITPDAFTALQEYGRTWSELTGRLPRPKDPIVLVQMGAHKNASTKILRDRVDRMASKAGLRDSKKTKRFEVPIMNGFRLLWNKTRKEAASGDSARASLIRKGYMMGHRGLVSLDQNYKTNVMELAAEYVKIVPDLTIDDAERLRRSNRMIAANIQRMEDEKDTKISRLESVAELKRRQGLTVSDVLSALKSPEADYILADVAESLTELVGQVTKSQKEAMREIRAEYDAKIEGMRREMDQRDRMGWRGNAGRDPPAWSGEDEADGVMRRSGPHGRRLES